MEVYTVVETMGASCIKCLLFITGKLVFAEPIPKDNEAATWREKLDQLYKSSSQSFRVVVHGSKVITFPITFIFEAFKMCCLQTCLLLLNR